MLAALTAIPAAAALAQAAPTVPVAKPAKPADPIAPLPDASAPAATTVVPPVVAELPPPLWQAAHVQALLAYIANVGRDGLSPDRKSTRLNSSHQ